MTLLESVTLAQSHAKQNFAANLSALPQLRAWVEDVHLAVEWVFARDKTLTALAETGHWHGGCSLPKRTAQIVLDKLALPSAVGCFLSPVHAAQIRVALNQLRPEQAIIAIVPDWNDLAIILHCDDFSGEISSNRLWFVSGPNWPDNLQNLFDQHAGLATPTQFIRTPDVENETIEKMIPVAQKVFSNVSTQRTATMQSLQKKIGKTSATSRLCIVAPSRFRLWNDLGQAMLQIFGGQNEVEPVHFDADDPACSSPLALVKRAESCNAIFTANTSRTDLPGLLPETMPWITWVTSGRIPSSALAGMHDHLILFDAGLRDSAIKSGWAAHRVHVGSWPKAQGFQSLGYAQNKNLSVLVDTVSLETPKDLINYSSHSLLWEAIRHELYRDPFVLNDVHTYLNDRKRRHGVGEEAFSASRFIEKLILPAYQQGLVRTLVAAKLPLKLYGPGWETMDEFKPFVAGEIRSREEFVQIVKSSRALLHVWPTNFTHPMYAIDIPVVRRTNQNAQMFAKHAQAVLAGKVQPPTNSPPPLTVELIQSILNSVQF